MLPLYDAMENKTRGSFASRSSTPVEPCPANTNPRPPEANASPGTSPLLNYSIQTGEEFALEFMRERMNSKKTSGHNDNPVNATRYVDIKALLGHRGSEVESDISMHVTGVKRSTEGQDKTILSESEFNEPLEFLGASPQVELGDDSCRGGSGRHASSSSSKKLSVKVGFLCSYGGKILPRPCDGKLRYVGGDTHILRIYMDISWQELKQKTHKICNHSHVIKYQLPGENLDSLITVSCEEDLQNMIDECLQSGDLSQKFRMFLFSSEDIDEMHLHLCNSNSESELQYVVAVNDVGLSFRKTYSDNHASVNVHVQPLNADESGSLRENRTETGIMGSSSLTFMSDPCAPAVQASIVHNCQSDSHSFQNHMGHPIDGGGFSSSTYYSHGLSDNWSNKISAPSLMPSIYSCNSHCEFQGPDMRIPSPSIQIEVIEGKKGLWSLDQETRVREGILETDCSSHQKDENKPVQPLKQKLLAASKHFDGYEPDTMHAVEEKCGASVIGNLTPRVSSESEGQCADIAHAFSNSETMTSEETYELKYDSNSQKPIGYFEHDFHHQNYRHSHYCPLFHSEKIPREQSRLMSRLSKSDESMASQFLTPQSGYSSVEQEPVTACINQFQDRNMLSSAESSIFFVKPSQPSSSTIGDSPEQLEQYTEQADQFIQMNRNEFISKPTGQESTYSGCLDVLCSSDLCICCKRDDLKKAAVHPVALATTNQNKVEEQSPRMGLILQKLNLNNSALLNDTRSINDNESLLGADGSMHVEKYVKEVERDNIKINLIQSSLSELDSVKNKGSAVKHQSDSYSRPGNDLSFSQNSATDVFMPGCTEFNSKPQSQNIANGLQDSLSPEVLSDIFSRAMMMEDSSSAMCRNDAVLSLNTTNLEPKSWSFFRNLAQNEFTHRQNDVSLVDQGHIGYASLNMVDEGTSQCYRGEVVELGHIQEDLFATVDDTIAAIQQDSVPSLPIHHQKSELTGEGAKMDNPFMEAGEELRLAIPDYEEGMLETRDRGSFIYDSMDGFNPSNLQKIKNEDLEELKELGSGTYGTVYHGKWRGTDVAIKRIKKSCFMGRASEQDRLTQDFWREAEILSHLHHPNIVAFYGVVQDKPRGTLATVTEFMVDGSLRQVLQRRDRYIDRRKRLIIAMDAAFGMEYLHTKKVVHFDLKCDNLLVNLKDPVRPICKVGDFGLSRIKRNTLISGGIRGTLPWMAPELLYNNSNKVSDKVDVFSFGVVMWEILTGEEPYANMHHGAIIGGIVNNTLRPPVPRSCDPDWRKLMEQCWAPDPAQRPSFTEIVGRLRSMSAALQSRTLGSK